MIEITPEYLASQGLSENFPQRFLKNLSIGEKCWIWIGKSKSNGYGIINCGIRPYKLIKSNRASWLLFRGEIPEGLCVLHNCPNGDNRACCNPNHLWVGTKMDNVQDAIRKGVHPHGETNGHSKLKDLDVIAIRKKYVRGVFGLQRLSKMFGVDLKTIHRIIRNEIWKHVKS